MKKAIVIVTGVKLSPVKREFGAGQRVTYIEHNDKKYKMNAAAGAIRQLVDDYEVICTGYNESDEPILRKEFGLEKGRYFTTDLLNRPAIDEFMKSVVALQEKLELPVHLVHYGGASDTSTKLPNDSLLAHAWDLRADALPDLVANNCVTLINVLQSMK